jgi:hypothetical protein
VYCRRQNSFVSSPPAPVRPAASSSSRPLAAVDEPPTAMTGAAEEQADLDAFDTARGLIVAALDEGRVLSAECSPFLTARLVRNQQRIAHPDCAITLSSRPKSLSGDPKLVPLAFY